MTQYYSPETNLRRLIELVEATPEDKLDLSAYVQPCGTIFCIAGLAATDPFFQAQGLTLEDRRLEHGLKKCLCVNGNSAQGHFDEHIETLFGQDAYQVFQTAGDGPEDFEQDFPAYSDGATYARHTDELLSDKQLALMRLRYQLEKVTQ